MNKQLVYQRVIKLGDHLRLLQEEMIDLENYIMIVKESYDKDKLKQLLMEIECHKGIIYIIISQSKIKRQLNTG